MARSKKPQPFESKTSMPKKSIVCNICRKDPTKTKSKSSFVNEVTFRRHYRQLHTKHRIFTCQHCGKICTQKSNLDQHMDTAHSNRKFICKQLSKNAAPKLCLHE